MNASWEPTALSIKNFKMITMLLLQGEPSADLSIINLSVLVLILEEPESLLSTLAQNVCYAPCAFLPPSKVGIITTNTYVGQSLSCSDENNFPLDGH